MPYKAFLYLLVWIVYHFEFRQEFLF
jgi:hypothetical protein